MKNTFTNIVIIFSIFNFLGCSDDFFKQELDPPQTATYPQCVVQGYLSPNDDKIKVDLRWSDPVFNPQRNNPENQLVENAKVTISNASGNSVQLSLDPNERLYTADTRSFPIKENSNYTIEVEIPNTPKITANCFVPAQFPSGIENIQVIKTAYDGAAAYQIIFEFEDIPNQENYYLADVTLRKSAYYTGLNDKVKIQPFTDFNRDGKKILVRSEKITTGNIDNLEHISIKLFSVDKAFYNYKRTILQQKESEDLGPFAEPVIIVSNINNGLGIFGGYTQISKEKNL